jgi:hypothetical protein
MKSRERQMIGVMEKMIRQEGAGSSKEEQNRLLEEMQAQLKNKIQTQREGVVEAQRFEREKKDVS